MNQKRAETWKTKDGTVLLVRNMTKSHIKNCIAMLRRYETHLAFEAYRMAEFCNGEIAQDTLEWIGDRLLEEGDDDVQEQISMFETELERMAKP